MYSRLPDNSGLGLQHHEHCDAGGIRNCCLRTSRPIAVRAPEEPPVGSLDPPLSECQLVGLIGREFALLGTVPA